ncbi:MAG: tyrosine-type recombinase/integrase [Alphaproteobacteria bacterium]|nr:tyrosine-type recombinase/integrase [Alphaproteobacteria bacterium]
MRRDRNYQGVSKFKDRHGTWRWRVRVKGKGTSLPGEYGSPEFVAAWSAYVNGTPNELGAARTEPGTINALLVGYYNSPEFRGLAEGSTRKNYRATLERLLRAKNGHKRVAELTRQGVISLRDRLEPHASNNLLRAMRHLCRYAVERGKLKVDPTLGLKKVKLGKTDGVHTWTLDEIEKFEARHKVGTRARLALDLMLYLGQRRSDIVVLGRQHERPGGASLLFRQKKTGARLELPIIAPLRKSIDATKTGALTYLENAYGRPFTAAGFGNWFRDRCDEADLPQCSAHGLRKAAATRLADAGASVHQIMAITGHVTLSEVERYTRAANQQQLAKSAAAMLGGSKEEQFSGNPSPRFARNAANALKRKE